MSNLIFGIFTILICCLGYFQSWKLNLKGKFKTALVLLIICGIILRFFTSYDLFLHDWDEKYHALVAKNLINHPLTPTLYNTPILPYDYKCWVANHIWLHKQPLPLWTIASSISIFGYNEIAIRIPSIILNTSCIALTYYIGKYFFREKTAFIGAFLFSINGLIIELVAGRAATDHYDIFFLFFIELTIALSIKYSTSQKTIYNLLIGFTLGAAILCKWLPALITLPIWILINYDSKKISLSKLIIHLSIILFVCLLTFLPWQIYIHHFYPNEAFWEANNNIKHINEIVEGRTGPFYYYFSQIRISYGDLIYLVLIWFGYDTLKNNRSTKRLILFVWIFVPILFFSFAETKMQGYILFISPALFIITGEFWHHLKYNFSFKYKWLKNAISICLILLPIRFTIERIKPFKIYDRNPEWVIKLKNLDHKYPDKTVLFNYNKPIEAMFYTNLTVYPFTPNETELIEIQKKGYTIILNKTEKKAFPLVKKLKYITLK